MNRLQILCAVLALSGTTCVVAQAADAASRR